MSWYVNQEHLKRHIEKADKVKEMSGDSTQSHRNDIMVFVDSRASLASTTSKEVAIQSGSGGNTCFVQAAVPVEKDKENEEEEKTLCSSVLENGSCDDSRNSDPEKTIPVAELSDSGKKKGKGKEKRHKFQICSRRGKTKIKKPAVNDDCTVACLYYLIQCCECTIL
ncbi:hypothetical protein JTB14_006801 [Gonioctena quinquepunctata]|nr:hypothetical protein JTB14_006801 [Gonioctena quinquepunctata]